MNRWRHLLEPLIQESFHPVDWEVACQQKTVIFDGDESVIVAIDGSAHGKRALQIWLAAGNMDEVNALYQQLETYAREQGFAAITYVGRKGWIKTHGFKVDCVVGIKELT